MITNKSLSANQNASTRSFAQPDYPGLNPYTGGFSQSTLPQGLPVVGAPKSNNPFANFNMGEIKGFIDRMGGINGLLDTMGKIQKIVGTLQQMAPMMKLLIPSKASTAHSDDYGNDHGRRRRRRRRSHNKRRTGKKSR